VRFVPTFRQLDENDSIVSLSRRIANGYHPNYEESEIAYAAIAYALTVFFYKLSIC
jgi:hypothetical protein